MPMELFEDAYGDVRNARFLGTASDLAYFASGDGVPKYKEQLGLDAALIQADNTEVYVGTNDNHIVVAFRGSESPTSIDGLKDWLLTNAANLLILPEGRLGTDFAAAGVGARFHQGFVNAIGAIWPDLFAAVDAAMKASNRPLWITGHSLGGALAILAGWMFLRKFVSVHQIYTFGGPMVGNDRAVAAINREFAGKIFRYVNRPDPVPHLPTFSLLANDFCHCNSEKAIAAAEGESAYSWADLAGRTADGALSGSLIDELWSGVKGRVAAHSMTSYLKLIQDDSKNA